MGDFRITVAGCGKGGPSMAAHLCSLGHEVVLYELPDFAEKLEPFRDAGGIDCTGEVTGRFTPRAITTDAAEAGAGCELLMVCAMAMGHERILDELLPHLPDGAVVAFNTGYFAGLRFRERIAALDKHVILAEIDILPYLCLRTGASTVRIDGIKTSLGVGTQPAGDVNAAVAALQRSQILHFFPRAHSLEASLSSMNPIFHPPIVLLNMPQSENQHGDYIFYREGVSPGVGKVIQAMDDERLAVGRALGFALEDCVSTTKRQYSAYEVQGERIDECLASNLAYSKDVFPMPSIKDFAVFHQDLAYGLPPLLALGELLGVPTPATAMIVQLSELVTGVDYRGEGLNAERLGIAGLGAEELRAVLGFDSEVRLS